MELKLAKKLAFSSVAAVVVMMMAATVLEKAIGTEAVLRYIYWSPVFFVLWTVVATAGLIWLLSRELHQAVTVTLHISFIVILIGAALTHFTSGEGRLHLREGETSSTFEGGRLPWAVTLDDFEIRYYDATDEASDYCSHITVEGKKKEISMNHTFTGNGYRLTQASYDSDECGSTLLVTYDPIGQRVTFAGYALLLLSMIGFFFQKGTRFRAALRRIATVVTLVLVPAMGGVHEASARDAGAPRTVSVETARAFGDLCISYNGRIAPVSTFARDFTMKVYGKPSYCGMSADQVLCGWIFYGAEWADDFSRLPEPTSAKKAARRSEASDIVDMVRSGMLVKIFPVAEGDRIAWYSQSDHLPMDMDSDEWLFVRKALVYVGEKLARGDSEGATEVIGKIGKYQSKVAGDALPSAHRLSNEKTYNAIGRPFVPAMASVTLGIILFILACIEAVSGTSKATKARVYAVAVLSAVMLAYLTVVLGLRWYVSGHVPMASGFEVMLLMAWLVMVVTNATYMKFQLIQPFGFILCGFCLMVAVFGESNPQITNLRPVLSSPLLSLHVATMMISYTLLGILALNCAMGLIVGGDSAERLHDIGLVILYPAEFLLTAGTFLGAVWASVSWGSYWGWDPKEVWALITLLIYSLALHGGSLKAFRRPKFFHIFCILAFLSVLVTYFGVNYFLGGMHSYA